jgi:hypothetical protein
MKLKCLFFGHDNKTMKVASADGKTYEVTYCLKCDKETHKEVK